SGVGISINPKTPPALNVSQTAQFTASVTGTGNTAVVWSASPLIGTLSASGLYTAPSTILAQRSITVTATSVADPTRQASATFTINAGGSGGAMFSLSPSALNFSATAGGSSPSTQLVTVGNSGGSALHWTLSSSAAWL